MTQANPSLIVVSRDHEADRARVERAMRIDALAPDRSELPPLRSLPPSPPEALAGEEHIRRAREHALRQGETRLDLLRRLLSAPARRWS